MSPSKIDDDPVIAEYDVFITPEISEKIFIAQYPNRPRNKPYNLSHGAAPTVVRIKSNSGYMEADVKLNTNYNYNKYMGLKWGEAVKVSKELHNSTGTFGPAAGLTVARPRASVRDQVLRDATTRELDIDYDLQRFHAADIANKALNKQTLGGLIIREGAHGTVRKTTHFVGAFRGRKLHLTKVSGFAQLRPQFHHVDAEQEIARLAALRTHQDTEPAAPGLPRNLRQTYTTKAERNTPESRLRKLMLAAEQERWISMRYVDEADDAAMQAFGRKFFVPDAEGAARLRSPMDSDQYLDTISPLRHNSPARRRRRPSRRKESATDVEDVDMADAEDEEGAAAA